MTEVLLILIGSALFLTLIFSLAQPTKAIKSLIALIAYLQLCLGPFLYYEFYQGTAASQIWDLEMAVDSNVYFSFLLPGIISFTIGLFFTTKKFNQHFKFQASADEPAKLLILAGFACYGALRFSIHHSLDFLLVLGASLAKCGILILHFQRIRNSSRVVELITIPALLFLLLLFYETSKSGMFEALVFWSFLLLVTSLSAIPKSIIRNLTVVFSGILLLVSLQTAKGVYRALIWNNGAESGTLELGNSLFRGYEITRGNFNNLSFWFPLVERVNQGRIVSHVIQKIEANEISKDINRVPAAIGSSLVPRLFWPNKPVAGGRENISLYTEIYLTGNTSMNISYFSDFFISFGRVGGVLSLFIWGIMMSWFIDRTSSINRNKTALWLSPIILTGIIPIETDLNMILNHMVKSTIFVFLVSRVLGQFR